MSDNLLKSCLKIHGVKNIDIARQTGYSPSYTLRIICGETFLTTNGPKVRHNLKIEKAIANSIGLTHEQAWGPDSVQYIKAAIERSLNKQELDSNLNQHCI